MPSLMGLVAKLDVPFVFYKMLQIQCFRSSKKLLNSKFERKRMDTFWNKLSIWDNIALLGKFDAFIRYCRKLSLIQNFFKDIFPIHFIRLIYQALFQLSVNTESDKNRTWLHIKDIQFSENNNEVLKHCIE